MIRGREGGGGGSEDRTEPIGEKPEKASETTATEVSLEARTERPPRWLNNSVDVDREFASTP